MTTGYRPFGYEKFYATLTDEQKWCVDRMVSYLDRVGVDNVKATNHTMELYMELYRYRAAEEKKLNDEAWRRLLEAKENKTLGNRIFNDFVIEVRNELPRL